MKYVISGATSPTGNAVIKRLADKVGAENITCVVRPTSDTSLLQSLGLKTHIGDVTEPESFTSLLSASVAYIDMTHPKHYHKSLEAVVATGVERAYYVTTTGIFSKFRRCADIYIVNEDRIRNSGVTYTILRPSMIYGTLRDRNMNRLIRFLDRYPVFPFFGDGSNLMQPVFTDDLADGIIAAIENPQTENQEYNLAGPNPIAYGEMIDIILAKLGKNVRKVHISPGTAAGIVRALQWIPKFPINDEQVLRMREDKAYDISKAVSELNFSPRGFDEGIGWETEEMRKAGMLR